MKTSVSFAIILLLIFITPCHTGCHDNAENPETAEGKKLQDSVVERWPSCYNTRVFFSDEDSLDLTGFIKSSTAAHVLRYAFPRRIRYQDTTQFVNDGPTAIRMSHLAILSAGVRSNPRHLSCIKINFGLDNKKIVPLFQLGYVKRTQRDGTRYRFYTTFEKTTYTYSLTNGFDSIKEDSKNKFLDKYKDSILIQHFPGRSAFDSINVLPDLGNWKNDSRAIIFSFQELFKFYDSTLVPKETLPGYCKIVYLHNAVALFSHGNDPMRFKHTMFFSRLADVKSTITPVKILTDPTMAANLAHLSPPNYLYCLFKTL